MASKEAEAQAAKWKNGKWYTRTFDGAKVRFRLENFRPEVVDKFNEALALEALRRAMA